MKDCKFTFIDLFAGIGGFRLALEQNGGHCIGFSEIAPDAISSYCVNYNESEAYNYGDITKLKNLPSHDFLTGGVPCQSWSIAGKNLGFDDSRGQLWNDALYLLNKSQPKAFIFENVKGLADPRNKEALNHIMGQIRLAGYSADYYILNSYDFGVPQNRVRIYIIGFKEEKYFRRFTLPLKCSGRTTLSDVILGKSYVHNIEGLRMHRQGQSISSNSEGKNDYFLFNDLRGGATTIHSWDLIDTSEQEKKICNLLLKNRRKRQYGPLDGNPLSLIHFKELDSSIKQEDIDGLIEKGILKAEKYLYQIDEAISEVDLDGIDILKRYYPGSINIDILKSNREFKIRKISVADLLNKLEDSGVVKCLEVRYDFKNTKISTGINGINRIFLPSSKLYPTLVASDTNDFISDVPVTGSSDEEYKHNFLTNVYRAGKYRRISKQEACMIQGFPKDFILPESRPRWMKLIGNSVAVTLISQLAHSVVATGVFDENDYITDVNPVFKREKTCVIQPSLFEDI